MEIEEFEKRVQPSAKRSRLEPFKSQIFELKAKGYADWQVKDWLAENGVEISRQAVQQFFKKEAKASPVSADSSHTVPVNNSTRAVSPQLTPKEEVTTKDEVEDDLTGKSTSEITRIKRERKAQSFITDQPSHPLLKNLKDNKS